MVREKMLEITAKRGPEKTCCPSDVVRSLFPAWREYMELCMEVGWELEAEGRIEVCQKGVPVHPPVRGPVRFRLKEQ